MPLTGSGAVLANAWDAALAAADPTGYGAAGNAAVRASVKANLGLLASVLMVHIPANAVVVVASVSGVTTGPGASGPGTGTLT